MITGGLCGAQEEFAKAFAASAGVESVKLVNIVPKGTASGYGVGRDVEVGAGLSALHEVFAQLAQVFLAVEGGPAAASEARAVLKREDAPVLPLMRGGGRRFDFRPEGLQRPSCATEEQWALLRESDRPDRPPTPWWRSSRSLPAWRWTRRRWWTAPLPRRRRRSRS